MDPADPVIDPVPAGAPQTEAAGNSGAENDHPGPNLFSASPENHEPRDLAWYFSGGQGLRAGWSVLIFYVLYRIFMLILGTVAIAIDPAITRFVFSPDIALIGELIPFVAILGAVAIVARIERRGILDYNLTGPRRAFHFFTGLLVGFAALSLLVGVLCWGGWLHFGATSLRGAGIIQSGVLWAMAFLMVGLVEEGSFRCYLQFTLTRGLNFWWALGAVCAACLDLAVEGSGNGIWGVYMVAAAGLVPCALLHVKRVPGSNFWQAAWVTSTLFGFIHTSNNGENWIGIFAAALIGFAFCVSVWATGSAWWAIGCHAAWDWAETYFYGAADSGNVATGHLFSTSPAGAPLWSGGTDGPEGSVLVIPVVLLLLATILVLYRRGKSGASAARISQLAQG
jgi:membrane protease YdiL (CAAX protease family)